MEKIIKKVFSDVFAVKPTKINNKTSFDNFEPWDSLKHTNLIIALEETFNIKFSSSEIIEMLNFKIIKSTIDKKNIKKNTTDKKIHEYLFKNIILKGKRLLLRRIQLSDVTANYVKWMNEETNRYILNVPKSNTMKSLKNNVQKKLKKNDALFFAIVDQKNNKHIGNAKLEPIDWKNKNAIIERVIGPLNYKSKGYGTESSNILLNFTFNTLKLKKVTGYVLEENISSVKSNIKNGFIIDRKLEKSQFINGKRRKLLGMTIVKKNLKLSKY